MQKKFTEAQSLCPVKLLVQEWISILPITVTKLKELTVSNVKT